VLVSKRKVRSLGIDLVLFCSACVKKEASYKIQFILPITFVQHVLLEAVITKVLPTFPVPASVQWR